MKKNLLYIGITALALSFGGGILATQTAFAQTTQTTQSTGYPVDLNTATDAQILAIPNTGQRFLREFKEYRPYVNITQFEHEMAKYVDQAQITKWEQYVYVSTNPNSATVAQLSVLKGVDKTMADYIVAGRSYKDWAALKTYLLKKYDTTAVNALERYFVFK